MAAQNTKQDVLDFLSSLESSVVKDVGIGPPSQRPLVSTFNPPAKSDAVSNGTKIGNTGSANEQVAVSAFKSVPARSREPSMNLKTFAQTAGPPPATFSPSRQVIPQSSEESNALTKFSSPRPTFVPNQPIQSPATRAVLSTNGISTQSRTSSPNPNSSDLMKAPLVSGTRPESPQVPTGSAGLHPTPPPPSRPPVTRVVQPIPAQAVKHTGLVPAFNPAQSSVRTNTVAIAEPSTQSNDGWSWSSIIGKASNAVSAAATTIGSNQGLRELYANVTPEFEKIAHLAENITATIVPTVEPTRHENVIVFACLDGSKSMEGECRKVCKEMMTDEGYPPANGRAYANLVSLHTVEDVPTMSKTLEDAFIQAEV